MRDQGNLESPLDVALYEKAQIQLRQFKSQLPPDSVESLAREVIRRLAERDGEITIDAPSSDQIEHLCFALLSDDTEAGAAYIKDARSAGASIEAVYLKYLSGAARMLGDWWDNDLVSFPQVTLGTSRMYAIMRAMRHQMPVNISSKSAVFVSVPGDTHTLGVRMATDLFRKEGWDIKLLVDKDHDTLMQHIVQSDAPIVGFSSGGQHSLQALSRLILALRIKKPENMLFVSGQIVEEAAGAIELIGVDSMASDIDTGKGLMQEFWQRLQI